MKSWWGLVFGAVALSACGHSGPHSPDNGNNGNNDRATVLRPSIGIDLAQVAGFVALSGESTSSQALRTGLSIASAFVAAEGEDMTETGDTTNTSPQLLALTLSGEVLEVKLAEAAGDSGVAVEQPQVQGIFPTASWILFSTPGFQVAVPSGGADPSNPGYEPAVCTLVAARRVDGALYCAPLLSNNGHWEGTGVQDTILANTAGDVVYTMAFIAGLQGAVDADSRKLYKIALGGPGGPAALAALDFPVAELQTFRVNGTGDLFVNYVASSMDPVMVSKILPLDGSSPTVVTGEHNAWVIAGEAGGADQDTFYVRGGGGVEEGTVRVVAKNGSSFTEETFHLDIPDAWSFQGLSRLRDGIYMFSSTSKELARIIVDGVVMTAPTRTTLTGVERIVGNANLVAADAGQWVFIAYTGSGYKFVRHDGVTQQDIPFDSGIDITSFTVARDGAIDFLGTRNAGAEKIHGNVAAGATEVTVTSAGVIDPAQVVVFTRIN